MSSEISTETQPLHPWQFFTLAGLIGATIVVFFTGQGRPPSVVILLSLTIFAAAAVGVAALRTFAPFTGSTTAAQDAPPVLGGRTRAALEREKALALRSIKELEFDRAMGKVSEKDFAEMTARLRARAARIMRQLDAGEGYRQEIAREVARRLESAAPQSAARETAAPESAPAQATAPDIKAASASAGALERAQSVQTSGSEVPDPSRTGATDCASCGTRNDADARFCKSCGTTLERNA